MRSWKRFRLLLLLNSGHIREQITPVCPIVSHFAEPIVLNISMFSLALHSM